MATAVTPEKIKSVLSSFLVKTEKSPTTEETVTKVNTSQEREDPIPEDTSTLKSNTAVLRSYKSFLKRLDTFSARTWFGKPAGLNPLICARHGWENVETDMLQCSGCKTFLSGKLPMICDTEAYTRSLEKLKKNIVESHDRFCVLGTFPCPEEFCHVQVDDIASLSASFTQRASALSEVQDHLPHLSETILEELGYDKGQAGAYCKRHLMPGKDISPAAVTLAFTGWTCSPGNKEILMCSLCRRKVGLWNFITSPESNADHGESSDGEDSGSLGEEQEPKVKKRRIAKKDAMHPVQEHNHWCPWIQQLQVSSKSTCAAAAWPFSSAVPAPTSLSSSLSPCTTPQRGTQNTSQSSQTVSTATIPVFIAALRSIAPGLMDNNTGLAAGMKKSPVVEGLRYFRRALDTWSSPKAKSLDDSQITRQSPAAEPAR